jgi:hypothetical protein
LSRAAASDDEKFVGEVTRPETLAGIAQDVDVVISAIGITRQRDGFSYEDVDYAGNANLLKEAVRSGVGKFVYVSVLHADQMAGLKTVQAKEQFVDELRAARCLDAIELDAPELSFGGPATFTHPQIAELAFATLGTRPRVTCISESFARAWLWLVRTLAPVRVYGPLEFTLTVLTRDMVGPAHGSDTLGEFFRNEAAHPGT